MRRRTASNSCCAGVDGRSAALLDNAFRFFGAFLPGRTGASVPGTAGPLRTGAIPASCRTEGSNSASALYRSSRGCRLAGRFLPGRDRPPPIQAGLASISPRPCSCGAGPCSGISGFFYGGLNRRRYRPLFLPYRAAALLLLRRVRLRGRMTSRTRRAGAGRRRRSWGRARPPGRAAACLALPFRGGALDRGCKGSEKGG